MLRSFMKSMIVGMAILVSVVTPAMAEGIPSDDSIAPKSLSALPWGDVNRFYINLQSGFFSRNVRESSVIGGQLIANNTAATPATYTWDHGHYGWTTGLGLGWSFYNDYSLEWALLWSSRQQLNITSGSGVYLNDDSFCLNTNCMASGSNVRMQTWWSYIAARGQYLLDEHWYAHIRLGFAYMHNSFKSTLAAGSETTAAVDISGHYSGHGNVFSPMLGLGVDYYFIPRTWLELDYRVMMGSRLNDDPYFNSATYSVNHTHVPFWQIVLLSLNVRL